MVTNINSLFLSKYCIYIYKNLTSLSNIINLVNILVVGGAGYVGGGIVDLLKKSHQVTVYDSLVYESSFRKKVDFIFGDIRDFIKLNKIFNQFDAVVWLAALVGDGACSINPALTHEINSETVKIL